MKKRTGLLFTIATTTLIGLLSTAWAASPTPKTSEVYLTITAGEVTIGTTDAGTTNASLDLGSISVSATDQVKEGTFAENFWVSDLKGNGKWHTTIQTNDMIGDAGQTAIPKANISIKAGTLQKLAGADNTDINLGAGWDAYRVLSNPLTFIQKTASTNSLLSKYGTKPSIKVTIPGYQQLGKYTATLTYTFMDL